MKTLLLPAVLLALVVGEAFAAAPRPNIVLLVADDLGFADVGFNGGKVIATPSLDRLAATGVTLADFRACPMCSPTRAGLLTGRWPLRFGLMRAVVPPWSRYGLPAEEATLPELLATDGYRQRAIVGKWHLGHSRADQLPLANGFSRFYGHYNGAIDHFTQERDGERDWHEDDRTSRDSGYATDLIGAEVVRLVQRAPTDEPWLVYVPFNAPHAPYQAKAEDLKKYPALEGDRRAYAAMVDAMDQVIGRILAAVEARRDAANTLVLFFSDNGGIPRVGSSNAPYRGAKLGVYEGGTRVAAAMRWPAGGVAGGRKFGGRIGYIDVLPTLLTAAGVPLPRNLDGVDFLPALRGTAALPERPWFSYIHQSEAAQAAVHLGPWKLVAHGDFFPAQPASRPTLELYQLETDPAEQNDVAAREPGKVAELHRLLREFGSWQMPGVGPYTEGREGFVPPKDWVVGAAPRAANGGDPGRAAKQKRKAGK